MLTQFAEGIADRLLQLDPSSLERLAGLSGEVIKVELENTAVCFYLLPDQEGVRIEPEFSKEPDLIVRGSFSQLLVFFQHGRINTEEGGLSFHGDSELGVQLGTFFAQLDLDWEEALSRFIGDTPARKAGNGARCLAGWAAQASESVERNISEYLQEELRSLPAPPEVALFSDAVGQLEQRVTLLCQRLGRVVGQ